jgi:hypothetical protein
MTASEFARLLNARRVGKGKWIAKCTAHPDRTPSLSIAEGRRVPVVIRCMSQNCDPRAILDAMGLRWGDLFDGKPTPEIRRRISDEGHLEILERRLGLLDVLAAVDVEKHYYWRAAVVGTEKEVLEMRVKIYPGERLPIRFRGKRT